MIIVEIKRGDYNAQEPAVDMDKLDTYLKKVLGFVAFENIDFIYAQSMDRTTLERVRPKNIRRQKV